MYVACTNGGRSRIGQIWRYRPSPFEGTDQEAASPGRLELFVESPDKLTFTMRTIWWSAVGRCFCE